MRWLCLASSVDFIFASLIFLILFTYVVSIYSIHASRYLAEQTRVEMEAKAIEVSELLVKTQGSPYNWENDTSSIAVIGLADQENVISHSKVVSFSSLSYDDAKNYLGISRDFHISLVINNSTTVFTKGNSTNTSSVSIRRPIIYNSSYGWLTVRLYG